VAQLVVAGQGGLAAKLIHLMDVCTLEELVAFLNDFDKDALINKPFSYSVNGRSEPLHRFTMADFV
jgi:hypothetical protein